MIRDTEAATVYNAARRSYLADHFCFDEGLVCGGAGHAVKLVDARDIDGFYRAYQDAAAAAGEHADIAGRCGFLHSVLRGLRPQLLQSGGDILRLAVIAAGDFAQGFRINLQCAFVGVEAMPPHVSATHQPIDFGYRPASRILRSKPIVTPVPSRHWNDSGAISPDHSRVALIPTAVSIPANNPSRLGRCAQISDEAAREFIRELLVAQRLHDMP